MVARIKVDDRYWTNSCQVTQNMLTAFLVYISKKCKVNRKSTLTAHQLFVLILDSPCTCALFLDSMFVDIL